MNITEFKDKIAGTKHQDWFNTVNIAIDFSTENQKREFEGLPSLYQFAKSQSDGWADKEDNLPKEFIKSKKYFDTLSINLIKFVDDNASQSFFRYDFDKYFNGYDYVDIKKGAKDVFFCNSPKTYFLLEVYNERPDSYDGALSYFKENKLSIDVSKSEFEGYLLAYEFQSRDFTELAERRNKEKKSITTLRNDFQDFLNRADELKENKEKLFGDWFINTKGDFENFSNVCSSKVEELETTYSEKLKLEEPAKYWSERGEKLKKQGWKSLYILVGLVLIVTGSLGYILWNPPTEIFNSFFEGDKSAAIRWSIIYITFISFMAYCIKAVNKVMFSSFHLARDCEERYTLTYFYLSLLKDSSVTNDEKQLIMQSLFSRADTGLLKEDSSPTMPNDIVGKVLNKS